MGISYKKLFEFMKYKGKNKAFLRKNGVYPATVDRIVKGGVIDTDTISKLCIILECQPGDILEVLPDKLE